MPIYTITQGDHLSALVERFGFRELKTIWDHPENAALKKTRGNPHILFPGDQLFIPDKQEKQVASATSKVHKFSVTSEKLKLKLVLEDMHGKPRSNEDCTLSIEGAATPETTSGTGTLEKEIPKTARNGAIGLVDLDVPLLIGHLDPVGTQSGQVARLNNLGYGAGDVDTPDPDRFRSAVEEFQCDSGLAVDGVCGPKTQSKLEEVHRC